MLSIVASQSLRRFAVGLVLGVACAGGGARAALTEDDALSALLKHQTQEFSEAGQRGDAAVMDRYLDPEVVFTNEAGEIGSKADLLEGVAPPPPTAPKRRIEVTNWALRRQGDDLATATFIDEVTQSYGGQILVQRFQSTETWAKRAQGWRMVASHTMNVVKAPPAIALPPAELDAYVGVYELDPTVRVTIAREGDGLVARTNGGPPTKLLIELKDVLFTAASPDTRRLFQRDAAEQVTGYINRRDGVDLVFRKVG